MKKIIFVLISILFFASSVIAAEWCITVPDSINDRYTSQLIKKHPKKCKTSDSYGKCITTYTDKEWIRMLIIDYVKTEVQRQDREDRRSLPLPSDSDVLR